MDGCVDLHIYTCACIYVHAFKLFQHGENESCYYGQTDTQPDFLQGWDLSKSSSPVRNMYSTKFYENR